MDLNKFKELNYEILKGNEIKESDCEEYDNLKEQVLKTKWYIIAFGFDNHWKPKIFIAKETSSRQEAQTEIKKLEVI